MSVEVTISLSGINLLRKGDGFSNSITLRRILDPCLLVTYLEEVVSTLGTRRIEISLPTAISRVTIRSMREKL